MMMNMKVFGSICILSFVLLATVSAQNETTTTAAAATTTTTAGAATTAAAAISTTTATATTTSAIVPTATTTASPPASTASPTAPTTATVPPPTTAPPTTQTSCDQDVTTKTTKIEMEFKITVGVTYSEVQDQSSTAAKEKKKEIEKNMFKALTKLIKWLLRLVITKFRPGSVIVEYCLVLTTSSEAEAANIANAVTEAIKSGHIGNYTTDAAYTPEAYIIRKVKASDVSPASDPTTTAVSTVLLIILGVALFILLVIIIILIVLVVFLLKLKKKGEK